MSASTGKFSCQFASHFHAHLADVHSADHTVWAREIDVFEHAECWPRIRKRPFGAQSVFINDQHFAGFNFADELRMNQIKSARLRCHDISVIEFAKGERAPAKRIANRD
jgi:hypothetical protein